MCRWSRGWAHTLHLWITQLRLHVCVTSTLCVSVSLSVKWGMTGRPPWRSNTDATSWSVVQFCVVTVTAFLSPLLGRWGGRGQASCWGHRAVLHRARVSGDSTQDEVLAGLELAAWVGLAWTKMSSAFLGGQSTMSCPRNDFPKPRHASGRQLSTWRINQ